LAKPLVERLAIIGLGLIGSSIARAARRVNAAATIVAGDGDPKVRARVEDRR
jgi:cyclohexadieny/prephenate dehydrogenase